MSGSDLVKCITSPDCVVELRDDKIIILTWAWIVEVDVERVKDLRVVRGKVVVSDKPCITS